MRKFFVKFLSIVTCLALALPSGAFLEPTPVAAQEAAATETTTDPAPEVEVAPEAEPTPEVVSAAILELSDPTVVTDQQLASFAPLPDLVQGAALSADESPAAKNGVAVGAASATLATGNPVQLGALPLQMVSAASQPLTVKAEILPTAAAQQWSPVGLAFTLQPVDNANDGVSASALPTPQQPLSLTLDYSQIPMPYGGSFQDRLTLYQVTRCAADNAAASNPDCAQWTALTGVNDVVNQRLTVALTDLSPSQPASPPAADQPVAAETFANSLYLPVVATTQSSVANNSEVIYVLAAAASGPQGDYKATPFTFAKDYEVALFTGSFQTSYGIPLPPAPAGLAPEVALQYDSGSVDGMTTTKNNQPGWVGIGWNLEAGHITRHLKSCENAVSPNDLCLIADAYSIVLNGTSSRLVKESGNLYRLQNDPRWKVELFANGDPTNPDSQKEYWLVTTPDGAKYRFGNEKDTETNADQNSVFYVPVYDVTLCAGSPSSLCNKAWQWNLDRVEDPNGNLISYFYEQELNYYKAITTTTPVQLPYVRAGNLSRIEYGRRVGVNSTGTGQVHFITEERCTPGSACTWPIHYPDTPSDLICDGVAVCDDTSPTFWSRKRLNYIETRYLQQAPATYAAVARIDLEYLFHTYTEPDGDVNEAKLWLSTITRKLGDGTGALPPVKYSWHTMANRYDSGLAGAIGFYMPRIDRIFNEIGGVINVNYFHSHTCTLDGVQIRRPNDCFRSWGPLSPSTYGWGYWSKWKVEQIQLYDDANANDDPGIVTAFGGNATQTYTYAYTTPIFRYSDDPTLPDINAACPNGVAQCAKRNWTDFRGHAKVTVTDASGAKSEYYFHRGMDGDRDTVNGGSFAANIALSDATTRLDSNWLAGQNVESRRLTSASVAKTRTVNWFSATLTAGSGNNGAYFVATQKSEATTYGTANKTTRTEYVYDSDGNLTYENQYGDTAITTDDRTVQRSYLANTGAYMVDRLAWQKLWAGIVTAGAPGVNGQEKAYSEFAYDNQAYGANPTVGNATHMRTYWQATPGYQSYETTTTYDSYGRPTSSTDGRGNSTTTAYDATYGYASSVTNDLGHITQSVVDPRWGVATQVTDANNKITTLQYDSYGRLSKVWLPSEPTSGVASYEFSYSVITRPAWVKSRQLRVLASSSYLENWSFVDGQGRTLQSQTPAASGSNKIVTSQNYNNLGQLVYSSVPYQLTGAAGTHSQPTWSGIVHYHQFYYDELGRVTKDETRATTTIQWDVITTYDGWLQKRYDANNTNTANNTGRSDALYNAFGQLSSVVEYNGAASYTTNYGYDLLGNLTGVTDHLGNVTSMSYDLLGRKTAMTDPDMGSWQYQYDAVGNLTGQRDTRNLWLYLEYDDLNRLSKKRRDTAATGPLLAEYLYDAVGQKGLPTSSKAYNAAGNTVEVEIQSAAYDSPGALWARLTQQQWVVNGVGSFRLDSGFNEANQQTSLTYPGGTAAQQGEAVTYGYNAIGQLTSVSGLLGVQYVSSATYNAQGQMTQLRNDSGVNGLTRVWTYTAATQRLSVMQAGTNASVYDNLQKLTYTYDSAGNVKTMLDTRNASQKQCFGYDGLYRLTSAYTTSSANTCTSAVATGTANYNHTYTYNEVATSPAMPAMPTPMVTPPTNMPSPPPLATATATTPMATKRQGQLVV